MIDYTNLFIFDADDILSEDAYKDISKRIYDIIINYFPEELLDGEWYVHFFNCPEIVVRKYIGYKEILRFSFFYNIFNKDRINKINVQTLFTKDEILNEIRKLKDFLDITEKNIEGEDYDNGIIFNITKF